MSGVLLGISCAETARYAECWESITRLKPPAGMSLAILVARSANIAQNRNLISAKLLESTAEWVLYADDDQVFLPDTVQRLVAHGRSVISGLYVARDVPFLPHIYAEEAPEGWVRKHRLTPGQTGVLPSVIACGAGCLLVHRRVLEALARPFWRIGQLEPTYWSDDIDFCRRVRAAGFPIAVDLDCPVGHLTYGTLWPTPDAQGWGTTVVIRNHAITRVAPPVEMLTT